MVKKTVEEIYQKKTQLEHILLRPDTYIGSVEEQTLPLWVYDQKMVYRPTTFVPGLYKIYDEIIVNAADNKMRSAFKDYLNEQSNHQVRDPNMDTIKINIDRENNIISILNNGKGIPVEMHAGEGVWVPELIFGHLLTSSNYDDKEEKITGGRNGYGAKLCNIFSKTFTVETASKESKKKFKQVFKNNMSSKSEPEISPNSKKEEYTKITFKPDLPKFGLSEISDDFYALLVKRVYDLAGCVRGVKVYLNDERIKIKNFQDYVNLYLGSGNPETGMKHPVVYERINDRFEVAFTVSDGQFNQVSFVNSICTIKGGTHVAFLADQIVQELIEAVKKKDKKEGIPLKPFQAKSHIWLFVNSAIVNPTFDSQTKETLTLKHSQFGSKPKFSEDFMKKVLKSGVVENVLSFAKFKQDQLMKKTDGSGKRTRISGLAKLDDANNAGGKNASQCTLILTEGDSAKSLAVSGLSVIGRDNFGVFPLRGKLLNVREASHSQIMANAEISAIKQILGLQQGKVYNDVSSLRYGSLMIMTDQDFDGSHIKGLIINFFDHFWPSLLKIPGFLLEFITPIVKATKGKGANKREHSFFTIPEYETWKSRNDDGKGWVLKYYKGLGTSTTEDAKKYFSDLGKHLKPFQVSNEESRKLIDMAFNKKKADDRKEWLRGFEEGTFMDHSVDEIPMADFINKELILFSRADNVRSIPCSVDGFKPGQRKILFSCFKRNLKSEIKVAQLAGYVSEHSAYHHGEVSLCMTIVNMAQSFVGSNNLNLLEPLGQFGTRLQGGKDAASPRYIFTNLSSLARAIFHPQDDPLLNYLNEDGQSIEPEWYIPVIPMLLVNGGDGIGTGWSTAIPNYNPRDIVRNIYHLMRDEPMEEIDPWYRGFEGTIEKENSTRYRVTGVLKKIDNTTIEITELPIKSWTQNYKETLESWIVGTDKSPAWIKDYKEYHTDSKVHFVIHLDEANMKKAEKEGLDAKFKTSTTITTSNLVVHDLHGRIRKYDNVNEIIKDFYELRLGFYHKRKDYMLAELTAEHLKIQNRTRFISEIVSGKLIVQKRKKSELLVELKEKKYDPIFKKSSNNVEIAEVEDDEETSVGSADHGYDYLLSMPIWSLTMEKIDALNRDKLAKEGEIKHLLSQTAMDLWRTDLDAFLVQWENFEAVMHDLESIRPENNTKAGGKKSKVKSVATMLKKKKVARGSDDDEDDEFSVASKASKSAPKVAKPPLPKKAVKTESDVSSLSALKPAAKKSKKDIFDFDSKSSLAPKRAKKIADSDEDMTSEGSALNDEIVELTPKPLARSTKVIELVSSESDFDMDAPVVSKKITESKTSSTSSSKRSSPARPAVSNKKIILGTKKPAVAVAEKKKASAPKAKKSKPLSDDDTVTDVTSVSRTARAKAPKKIIISDNSDDESEEASFSEEISSEQFSSDYD